MAFNFFLVKGNFPATSSESYPGGRSTSDYKLFVTNLPEGCSGTDLAEHVRPFGQIFNLYIARKRDKGGNRFGFVSMLDVKDKDDLLKSLRNIRMGEYKLWFNIARFVLEDGEISSRQENMPNKPSYVANNNRADGVHMDPRLNAFVTEKRSFKDSLVGKKLSVDNKTNAFSSLHGRALMQRWSYVRVSAKFNTWEVWTFSCLLKIRIRRRLFSRLHNWLWISSPRLLGGPGQSFRFERLAWLKVKGVPIHLLTNEVIDDVGGLFGKVVHKATIEESDVDLTYEYIGVLLGDAEELGEWIPEFVEVSTHMDDKQSESDKEESLAARSSDGVTEKLVEEAGEVNMNVDQVFLVMDNAVNEGIDGTQSLSNDDMAEILEHNDDTFIPAVDFPFEEEKNSKKNDLGRPSFGYVSSQESLKNGKKSKNEDPFGLDGLLGLNDKNGELGSAAHVVVTNDTGSESLDLNRHHGPNDVEDCLETEDVSQFHPEADTRLQVEEITATIALGEKLGTDLSKCNTLIQESITNEGLQRGVCGKSGWIKRLKNEFGVSFIDLQETMVSNIHEGVISKYWGGLGFEFEYVDAIGCVENIQSVLQEWTNIGPPDTNLLNKLERLRFSLKEWFKVYSSHEVEDESKLHKEKEEFEMRMESTDLEESDLWVWLD
ncbi:RNA-directed DNA polymerase, eukaryota [Artemisia annua]|uniref:RNA-directed DNA polymerase, eukaryota n=1 Tax=Artemisia annua TaxID=35608 RepID=A0A2U1Q9E3_ARTAN|nr:RNA-directed DNA polymerase, eukaryota [Artemisia annua]